jgi:hypothetical protein
MNSTTAERVERVRTYLLESKDLTEPEKDHLQTLLDLSAEATNGHQDKLQAITEVLHSLVIHEIRTAIRTPARINQAAEAAVSAHVTVCPLRGGAMPRWMLPVYAFRWPAALVICVGFMSPHAVALMSTFLTWCRQ